MSKRKLQSLLTIEQKRNICQYNEKYKGIKQKELIIHFSREFKLERPISKSTMSDILQESEKFLKLENCDNNDKKRLREAMLPEIEECLYIWLCSKRSLNIFYIINQDFFSNSNFLKFSRFSV